MKHETVSKIFCSFLTCVLILGQQSALATTNTTASKPYEHYRHLFHTGTLLEKAKELYESIVTKDSTYAYIYKFSEKESIQNKFLHYFKQFNTKLKSIHDQSEAEYYFSQQLEHGNLYTKLLITRLNTLHYLDKYYQITNAYPKSQHNNERRKLKKFFKKSIRQLGTEFYFKSEKAHELELNGTIYFPEKLHTWPLNLTWILGHIQKGNSFIITSDITKKLKRQTHGYEGDYSALAREIVAALKAGYIAVKTKSIFILVPPEDYDPGNCTTTGERGNGINPSDEEVNLYFTQLEKLYNQHHTFTFSICDLNV